MERIILIETSTALCSVALCENGVITAFRKSDEPRAHASKTALFIKETLEERGLTVKDFDAVAVSEGPGSYTGLRVGVSTAKGLCFGAGIPLISVGTLDTLTQQAHDMGAVPQGCRAIVPMVDARRMEVYTAIFNPDGTQVTETEAKIITESSFSEILEEGPVLFIGDGAEKCRNTLVHPNARFLQCCPEAAAMLRPAVKALNTKDFKDTAYFEPFYLKEFVTTVSKKKLF